MWLFTPLGFVSVVKDNQHPTNFLCRFRTKQHARAFRGVVYGAKSRMPIRETPNADYRWKFSIEPHCLMFFLTKSVESLTYTNFKDTCHDTPEMADHGRALMATWAAWNGVQREEMGRDTRKAPVVQSDVEPDFDQYRLAFSSDVIDEEDLVPVNPAIARYEEAKAEAHVEEAINAALDSAAYHASKRHVYDINTQKFTRCPR